MRKRARPRGGRIERVPVADEYDLVPVPLRDELRAPCGGLGGELSTRRRSLRGQRHGDEGGGDTGNDAHPRLRSRVYVTYGAHAQVAEASQPAPGQAFGSPFG